MYVIPVLKKLKKKFRKNKNLLHKYLNQKPVAYCTGFFVPEYDSVQFGECIK